MADRPFVEGLRFWPARAGAPDFVIGSLSLDPKKLVGFLKAHGDSIDTKGYFKIDILARKDGDGWSLVLNDYKKPQE